MGGKSTLFTHFVSIISFLKFEIENWKFWVYNKDRSPVSSDVLLFYSGYSLQWAFAHPHVEWTKMQIIF